MLVFDPSRRLTAMEVLKHPFFSDVPSTSLPRDASPAVASPGHAAGLDLWLLAAELTLPQAVSALMAEAAAVRWQEAEAQAALAEAELRFYRDQLLASLHPQQRQAAAAPSAN